MPRGVDLPGFVARIVEHGDALYRDFAWRRTSDPYAVLLSEVMLQQTQVSRVEQKYEVWLDEFPTLDSLAAAPLSRVLELWQGLGYNRRAVALKRAAEQVAERFGGQLPADESQLLALPGIGPATAAGIRAFAHDLPSDYLETNIRTVFLHELFGEREDVPDREILPLVHAAVMEAAHQGVGARTWYYSLLDYGAHLKRAQPNPSRRSAHHTRQSRFEGSRRQKRARLLRAAMADPGLPAEEYADQLASAEQAAGREAPTAEEVAGILGELAREGFLVRDGDRWVVA
jgi:A/G-specific adenine glycosylase